MNLLSALLYDFVMKETEKACLIEWRATLLKNVSGSVLELGAGTGASIALYPKQQDLKIVMAEPDGNMRKQLQEKLKEGNYDHISVIDSTAENIAVEDAYFDYVFVSLVCCSVNDVPRALKEVKRVLKEGGKFVFLEHVAAGAGTSRRKWQDRLTFIWRRIAGNCHLNRETERMIHEAGFDILQIERESMRKAMPLVRPTIRGIAVKRGECAGSI